MGEAGYRRNKPTAHRDTTVPSPYNFPTRGRRPRLPGWLRVQKLTPRSRDKSDEPVTTSSLTRKLRSRLQSQPGVYCVTTLEESANRGSFHLQSEDSFRL